MAPYAGIDLPERTSCAGMPAGERFAWRVVATNELASIRSSAESSRENTWRKLAAMLRSQLARCPQASPGRLGLVYLAKSEVVKPGRGSKLPESRDVSAEQLRDELLPPAVSFNVGVKADTSVAGQRVVSVTLASSQVL